MRSFFFHGSATISSPLRPSSVPAVPCHTGLLKKPTEKRGRGGFFLVTPGAWARGAPFTSRLTPSCLLFLTSWHPHILSSLLPSLALFSPMSLQLAFSPFYRCEAWPKLSEAPPRGKSYPSHPDASPPLWSTCYLAAVPTGCQPFHHFLPPCPTV